MTILKVKLLGTFEVSHSGNTINTIPRRKAIALLAYLCLEQAGKSHQRDTLTSLLWPESSTEEGRHSLRQCLYQLRRTLHDHNEAEQSHFQITNQAVCLLTDELECDVTLFLELAKSTNPADWETALQLYRGELLAGFNTEDSEPFEEWLFYTREQIQRSLTQILQRQKEAATQAQNWPAAIEALNQLLALDPLDEGLHQTLMQAYFANGQRGAALEQYNNCRTILAAELQMEPHPETTALYDKLKSASFIPEASQSAVAAAPTTTPEVKKNTQTLPAVLTSFIGRDFELSHVKALLLRPNVRLLTLTGPGGSGKTRLALEVARAVQPEFENNVYFVALANITKPDPDTVIAAIAAAIGVKEGSGDDLEQKIATALSSKKVLLVLDNFEHIISTAFLLENLLNATSNLKIVVTSRFLLKLYGEYEYVVQPLALPKFEQLPPLSELIISPAVNLFVERAQAVNTTFDLNNQNALSVVEICNRLDGLPLAIELVAARIKLYAPQAIVARLSKRLALATGGPRSLPQRQQTLQATIEWSYNLLEAIEKQFFERLSIFIGDFSSEAALAVGADLDCDEGFLLDLLFGLVDKSLLQSSPSAEGEPRFQMLETIKEFSLAKLTENQKLSETTGNYVNFFFKLADYDERTAAYSQTQIINLFQQEHANLRASLEHLIAQPDAARAVRMTVRLGNFWNVTSYYSEGRTYLSLALALPGEVETIWRAKAYHCFGLLALSQEDFTVALDYFQKGLEAFRLVGDKNLTARALGALGIVAKNLKDYPTARHYHQEGLILFEEMNDKLGVSRSLNNIGQVALLEQNFEEARDCFTKALELRRELNDDNGIAICLNNLSELEMAEGKFDFAAAYAEESLSLSRKLNNKVVSAFSLKVLGEVAYQQGDYLLAYKDWHEELKLQREVESKNKLADCLCSMGKVTLALEDFTATRTYYLESFNLYQQLNDKEGVVQSLSGFARSVLAEEVKQTRPQLGTSERVKQAARLIGAISKLTASDTASLYRIDDSSQISGKDLNTLVGSETLETAFREGQKFSLEQLMQPFLVERGSK